MLTTDRLVLRDLRDDDADFIAREIAHPEVHRWLPHVPFPYGLDKAQGFINLFKNGAGNRLIEADGQPIGVVTVSEPSEDIPLPALGYWLAVGAHGKGYMTEAARAMVDWHFTHSDLDLGSGWVTGNDGSEKVLMKLGFRRNGIVKDTHVAALGQTLPVIKCQLSKQDWTAQGQT